MNILEKEKYFVLIAEERMMKRIKMPKTDNWNLKGSAVLTTIGCDKCTGVYYKHDEIEILRKKLKKDFRDWVRKGKKYREREQDYIDLISKRFGVE